MIQLPLEMVFCKSYLKKSPLRHAIRRNIYEKDEKFIAFPQRILEQYPRVYYFPTFQPAIC